jgi:Bacterial pre-peptidase C-terminal domain
MKQFRAGWLVMIYSLSLLVSCGSGGGGGGSSTGLPGGSTNTGNPLVSEGTSTLPKDLGTASLTYPSGSVAVNGSSYYQFTTARSGSYVIRLANPTIKLMWDLFLQKADFYTLNYIYSADNIFSSGTLTDAVGTARNIDGNTVYYLEVLNYDMKGGTYTISIQQGDSEGSINMPIVLTPDGSSHAGGVDLNGYSYYTFTTSTAGSYLISLKGLSAPADTLSWTIYSDPSFQTPVASASCNSQYSIQGDLTCGVSNLPAGTYYLMVYNLSVQASSYSIAVTPDTIGYAGTAVTLNPETRVTGTIFDNELQYYSFTPVSSGTYSITLSSSQNIGWDLYSDVTCSTLVTDCPYNGTWPITNTASCVTSNLPRGTYYLKIANNAASTGSYDLIVSGQGRSEGAIGDPVVLTSRTPYTGGHVAPGESSYYTFKTETLTNPSPYLVTLTSLSVLPNSDLINWNLYSDQTFSTNIATCFLNDFVGDIVCSTNEGGNATAVLSPNTSYYLQVVGNSYASYMTYTATVTPLSSNVGCSDNGTCYNFESNSISPFTAYSNDPLWITASTSGTGGTGSYNAQSGIVQKNQAWSCFQTTLTNVKWVTFSFSTQFGAGATDQLNFYVDYVASVLPAQYWTGTNAWQRVVITPTSGGLHTYGWCHYKPDTTVTDNNAWVDDIEFNY